MLFTAKDCEKDRISLDDDLPKICRFCLRSDFSLKNIFAPNLNGKFTNDSLQAKIKRSLHLEVCPNDGLPSSICYRCIERIETYADYHDKCIENDRILRHATSFDELKKHVSDENEKSYMQAIQGITEFYPDENSMVLVIDPNKEYDSDGERSDKGSELADDDEQINLENFQTNEFILRNCFLCKYCDCAFATTEECEAHEYSDHDQLQPYKCNFCELASNDRSTIITHIKSVHESDRPFICIICEKGFNRRSYLKKHTIIHTGVRPFTCPVCSKNFSRKTNLTKHLRIHSGLRPHVCPKCPRSFITKSQLFRHFSIHTGDKPTMSRRSKAEPNTSIKNVPVLNNLNSSSETVVEAIHNHHLQHHHSNSNSHDHDDNVTENMVIALNPYSELQQIEAPSQISENGVPVGASGGVLRQPENGFAVPDHIHNLDLMFTDNLSTSQLVTYQNLEKTQQSLHAPQHQQPAMTHLLSPSEENGDGGGATTHLIHQFKCDQCPNVYSTRKSLKCHQDTHLGVRPHVCHVCQKGFYHKRELNRHLFIHTGVKPFACTVCPKRFGRKDKLIRHERIHSNKNEFHKCIECMITFERKEELVEHLNMHKKQQEQLLNDMREEDEHMVSIKMEQNNLY